MLRASHMLSAALLASLTAIAAPAYPAFGAPGNPVTVTGVAADLPNTAAGDLWQFDFLITGAMATGERLRISLAPGLFDNITLLTPTVPNYLTEVVTSGGGLIRELQFTDQGSTAVTNTLSVSMALKPGILPMPYDLSVPAAYDPIGGATGFGLFTVRMQPVPEPATVSMFALGLLGLGLRARRRKSNA